MLCHPAIIAARPASIAVPTGVADMSVSFPVEKPVIARSEFAAGE